ncbi:MAG: hypothetical protein ACKVX7_10120 [Planctomycetota bacterium]
MVRGSAGLLAFASLLVGLTSGCRLHLDYVQRGTPWSASDYQRLTPHVHDRGDVLQILGPPDVVTYSTAHEVFLYRIGGHRGSELVFFIPVQAIPGLAILDAIRSTLRTLFGNEPATDEFSQDLGTRIASSLLLGVLNLAPSDFATPDPLNIRGRRLRYDVVRIVLDRRSLSVLGKEEFLGIEVGRSEQLLSSTLLRVP